MKIIFRHFLFVLVCCALTFTPACKRHDKAGSADSGQKSTRYLTIKGSDTMVHLVSTWAEKFMQTSKGSEVSVTGGGSGTGIAALLNGTTDICAASRSIQEKELNLARQKGLNPLEVVVARDGIAVVVNPENPVSELSVEQIGKIFSGAYKRWSDVGGTDEPIIVLSRESSSGTFIFFQEHVLSKADYTPNARFLPGTSAVIQAIETDKLAIGYVGLGFTVEAKDKVKALQVKADNSGMAISPSEETVKSGEYSIARPLYLYTNGEPSGLVKEFIDFCLSTKGQEIVRETGYVPQ
ncbi:MAG: PstS family phosphate ABC transporter substrate-binding protein [Proteobacteria bacterium]|nr:PstS family phosphate ABC transporter substrate-binding protein [Pseudomonadota bacterium]MBU1709161.1 PstS family phosphate ABC transporter substrate-binding protein [Pseudomonadota bacterium]